MVVGSRRSCAQASKTAEKDRSATAWVGASDCMVFRESGSEQGFRHFDCAACLPQKTTEIKGSVANHLPRLILFTNWQVCWTCAKLAVFAASGVINAPKLQKIPDQINARNGGFHEK
jgi:hypothetical protein